MGTALEGGKGGNLDAGGGGSVKQKHLGDGRVQMLCCIHELARSNLCCSYL